MISRTSKGNGKLVLEIERFEKSRLKLQRSLSKGNKVWFKKSGGLRNQGLEKSDSIVTIIFNYYMKSNVFMFPLWRIKGNKFL